MKRCASVQDRLTDEGVDLVARDAGIGEHVAGCAECSAFLQALERVDADLARLAPLPAPRGLLERTAKAVGGNGMPPAERACGDQGARQLAGALAATVILAAGFGLVESLHEEVDGLQRLQAGAYSRPSSDEYLDGLLAAFDRAQPAARSPRTPALKQARPSLTEAEPGLRPSQVPGPRGSTSQAMPARVDRAEEAVVLESPSRELANEAGKTIERRRKEQKKRDRQAAVVSILGTGGGDDGYRQNAPAEPSSTGVASSAAAAPADEARAQNRSLDLLERALAGMRSGGKGEGEADAEVLPRSQAEIPELQASIGDARSDSARVAPLATPARSGRLQDAKDKLEKNARDADRRAPLQSTGPRLAAQRFLAERERLRDLAFQSATGYWANTYVPGDPAIRLLEARLQRWDRSTLRARIGDAALEAGARQNRQPFDVPENAALAAYMHADKRAISGPSRLRVQVGLQASQKRGGLRPDMNVGLVLDLRRNLDDETGAEVRALVAALAKARQPGDRFSITVAGHPGGLLVAPEQFRHGPIQVAMQRLFAPGAESRAQALDLPAALDAATNIVRQGDDASAPLGASLVLLVSSAPFDEQRALLESMAHENAVGGIGLSVVAVGDGADLDAVDRLVLLGQGHRRVLTAAEDATKLVDRELHASSRAVARAVRLRIRLAPGVELIDVLGSKNLSEQAAQRVRDAEKSIDQRLSRNIGIRADRGKDEEGIQIVIPSFFAGDSHVVLLDVVVPGPGPVADVSVRYKDLVYRRNGVSRTRLAVEDGHRAPGPLERNVFKNQLAHETAKAAATAGRMLRAGDHRGAVRTLAAAHDLLAGMRLEIPGWDNDKELRDDEALLAQYLKALQSGHAGAGPQGERLADSLRYVAFRRLIPAYK